MKPKYAIYVLIFGLFVVAFTMLLLRIKETLHIQAQTTIVFSEKTMLRELWQAYTKEYLEPDTYRTLDKQRNNITTSEGESYTMLRAVWEDDKETFDRSWKWTQEILQRKEDHLFSWLFGQRSDGSYGVLTDQGGHNSATDADTDIALSLIFAYGRWNDSTYLESAKLIIKDIWANEIIGINGKYYVLSNNLEKSSPDSLLINPSYIAPYAYRIFAEVDTDHPWLQLADHSYEFLSQVTTRNLDAPDHANLPPDWVYINRQNGEILTTYKDSGFTSNFGFDGMRLPWRIALDYIWYQEGRAKDYLANLNFLSSQWRNAGKLYAVYTHDGKANTDAESLAMYGGSLGYFVVNDPGLATEIYISKLEPTYSPDKQSWTTTLNYYDANWAWFGMALYNHELPNLAINLHE
jgi:endoglucanase